MAHLLTLPQASDVDEEDPFENDDDLFDDDAAFDDPEELEIEDDDED